MYFYLASLVMAHSHLILSLDDYDKGVKCQFKEQEEQNSSHLFMRDQGVYTTSCVYSSLTLFDASFIPCRVFGDFLSCLD
jgi:hypothetical protein